MLSYPVPPELYKFGLKHECGRAEKMIVAERTLAPRLSALALAARPPRRSCLSITIHKNGPMKLLLHLLVATYLLGSSIYLYLELDTFASTSLCVTSSLDQLEHGGGYGAMYASMVGDAKSYFGIADNTLRVLPAIMIATAVFGSGALLAIRPSPSDDPSQPSSRRCTLFANILFAMLWLIFLVLALLGILIETPELQSELSDIQSLCECVGPPIEVCSNEETPIMHLAWLAMEAASGEADSALSAASQYSEFDRACSCLLAVRGDAIRISRAGLVALMASMIALVTMNRVLCSCFSNWVCRKSAKIELSKSEPSLPRPIPSVGTTKAEAAIRDHPLDGGNECIA